MYKTFVAGITAISLTLSTAAPAQANGFSEDDFGKLVFGLIALAGIATAIDKHSGSSAAPDKPDEIRDAWPKPRTPRHPQQPRNDGYGNNPYSPNWGHTPRIQVPRRCLDAVSTRYGRERIVDGRCIRRTTNLLRSMPRQCRVRLYTQFGPRGGWDPHCLRDNGIRVGRRN